MFKPYFFIIGLLIVVGIGTCVGNQSKVTTLTDVKIIDKQQQQKISGTDGNISTEYRYIVVTDKGTFICESNLIQGKFNNSDIFYHIKVDSVYKEVKVSGYGKGFFFDYQNILSVR